jgi:hypothetical protein
LGGIHSHNSPGATLGRETKSRLARGHPRAENIIVTRPRPASGKMHISDSPEDASDDAQKLPASTNHSSSETCVRTFIYPAEGAKVNKGQHDYGLIYFHHTRRCIGHEYRALFPHSDHYFNCSEHGYI